MKKAWKGTTDVDGDLFSEYHRERSSGLCKGTYLSGAGPPPGTPVLVIDASDFPDDYPMIGSEMEDDDGDHVEIKGPPVEVGGKWFVTTICALAGGRHSFPYQANISTLKPIPTKATDEVVGTLTVKDGELAIFSTSDGNLLTVKGEMDPGTYDIIKRSES